MVHQPVNCFRKTNRHDNQKWDDFLYSLRGDKSDCNKGMKLLKN